MPTINVVAAVIQHDGKFLLTRRPPRAHLEGLWEFPGGKIEEGESPEQALMRECSEECAIDVVVHDILDVTFFRYPRKDVLLLFYACTLGERKAVQHLEVSDHRWVDVSELRDFELPPPDERLIAKLERGVWPR
jgi:8-oxo-dGTP diphosphatase